MKCEAAAAILASEGPAPVSVGRQHARGSCDFAQHVRGPGPLRPSLRRMARCDKLALKSITGKKKLICLFEVNQLATRKLDAGRLWTHSGSGRW